MIEFLEQTVFTIGNTPTTLVELLGFITGILTIYLLVVQNIWNFPLGIIMVSLFFILFINAKLYADAWLQVVYFVLQAFGWWAWLKAGPNRTALKVRNTKLWMVLGSLVFIIIGTLILRPILKEAHGSYPFWDALTTSLSLAAQALLSFKIIENWYLWIIADIIYVPLYFAKDLYLTSIVYVIFMGLCVMGLREWSRAKQNNEYVEQVSLLFNPIELEKETELG